MNPQRAGGVWVPALTPFDRDLAVETNLFVAHCRWLLEQGVDGLAVFGTTSEANSLSVAERTTLLESLVADGVPAQRLMPGVGCCALPDTVALCRHADSLGCSAVLMLPPFYYKNVTDEGLFAAFSSVFEALESTGLCFYLYHIPPVTQVPLSPELIARLVQAYPGRVAGIKDSGGDWTHTRAMLEQFPELSVFAGSERFLLDTLRHAGAGCITASGNVNPGGIRLVYERWLRGESGAQPLQERITALRNELERFPMIPALKALCAEYHGDGRWLRVRPPLVELSPGARGALLQRMEEIGFGMGDARNFVDRSD